MLQIIVAQTLRDSAALSDLFKKLSSTFPNSKVECIPRRYMNESKGRECVQLLHSRDSSGIDIALESKYAKIYLFITILCRPTETFFIKLSHNHIYLRIDGINVFMIDDFD